MCPAWPAHGDPAETHRIYHHLGASLYEQIALVQIQPVLNNWKIVMHTANTTESSFFPSKLHEHFPHELRDLAFLSGILYIFQTF